MRRMSSTRALALSTIGLVGLALQGAAAPARAYDIDVILSMTGGAAFLGKEGQTALQLAEAAINKSGGVHGQKVHFIVYDDQTNPQIAVQMADRVMASKPAVVLGSSLVGSCNAMAAQIQERAVIYCFSPGVHPAAGSYVFSSSNSSEDGVIAEMRYFRLKGWTRIATMTSADATGQSADRVFDKVLALPENKGVTIVNRAHFNTTDVSVAAQIEHIQEAGAQAMMVWATGNPIGTVYKGAVQAGLDIPFGTHPGNMTYAQMKNYASFLPKQLYFYSSEWVPQLGGIKLDQAVEKARKQFFDAFKAVKTKPDFGATLAWDPAMIVVEALRHLAPNPTATQVRDYIAHLKGFAGINGVYDFPKNPQRGLDVDDVVMSQWNPAHNTWQVVSKPAGTPLGK